MTTNWNKPTPTTPTPPQTDPWADTHGQGATTAPKGLLETLIEGVGPEEAFRIWARRRTPSPCRPALWNAQRLLSDAKEAELDAIADAKEARMARRAAAATLAESRADVALQRAVIARARVS